VGLNPAVWPPRGPWPPLIAETQSKSRPPRPPPSLNKGESTRESSHDKRVKKDKKHKHDTEDKERQKLHKDERHKDDKPVKKDKKHKKDKKPIKRDKEDKEHQKLHKDEPNPTPRHEKKPEHREHHETESDRTRPRTQNEAIDEPPAKRRSGRHISDRHMDEARDDRSGRQMSGLADQSQPGRQELAAGHRGPSPPSATAAASKPPKLWPLYKAREGFYLVNNMGIAVKRDDTTGVYWEVDTPPYNALLDNPNIPRGIYEAELPPRCRRPVTPPRDGPGIYPSRAGRRIYPAARRHLPPVTPPQ